MKKLLILLTFAVAIASCKSPCQISERKVQKLEAKCPEVFKETIVVRDTVFVPEKVVADTSFVTELYDTITFTKNDVRVKIRRINDTIIVDSIVCITDTVFFEKEVVVERLKLEVKPPFFKRIETWVTILIGILVSIILLKITKRFFL
ncbi:MAG: hypothetical protein Unbinned4388contig1000_25 [Prokaryotic dsDNA virus sp.]|nr:MAG: hypothetical protein Unbinned4388contig1000_25 [Prokaryotic dsDNA virus sp.]|tara:strand:- start:50561 stop:51004 length:444 start_codon:yes stop_codon:yes gene_type:complete